MLCCRKRSKRGRRHFHQSNCGKVRRNDGYENNLEQTVSAEKKNDKMMTCEEENLGVEITRAVYDVARRFLDSGFRDFTLCEKNVVNVQPGELVVYQEDAQGGLPVGMLRVGHVQSMIVSPLSGRTSFYCNLFTVCNDEKCFKATGRKFVRVTYEQMRLKLLDTTVQDGIGIVLKNGDSFPWFAYFE